MSESLRDIIEKVIIKEENIETDNVVYSELISLKKQIEDKIEELKETGNLGGFIMAKKIFFLAFILGRV